MWGMSILPRMEKNRPLVHPWPSEAAIHRMWEVPILPCMAKNRPRRRKRQKLWTEQRLSRGSPQDVGYADFAMDGKKSATEPSMAGDFPHILPLYYHYISPLRHCNEKTQYCARRHRPVPLEYLTSIL
jgi:hypothetical protein